MRCLVLLIFFLLSQIAEAHPSWGITVTDNGDIYFVDVLHNNGTLWRVNADGELFEVLTGFHAHDLSLDKQGNIWLAENLMVESVLDEKGQHTLIKINPESTNIDTLLTTLDNNLLNGTSIGLGKNGVIFFVNENKIYKHVDGKSKLIADYNFKRVKSIICDENGTLWITDSNKDNGTLYQFTTEGVLKSFATDLMPEKPVAPLFKEKHLQFLIGIAKDDEGNLYVSENAGCRIIKINQQGEKSTFYQSPSLWSPMNVAFHEGDAYIMEVGFNKGNTGPRIIKKTAAGAISRVVNIQTIPEKMVKKESSAEFSIPTWVYFGLGLLVFALAIILSVRKQYKSQ